MHCRLVLLLMLVEEVSSRRERVMGIDTNRKSLTD